MLGLSPYFILHADAWGVNHEVTPVSLEDPLLLARQVDQLLAAALHVLVQRSCRFGVMLVLVLLLPLHQYDPHKHTHEKEK